MERITPEQISTLMNEAECQVVHRMFDKQCIVVAKLRNGFTIVGESACIDPSDYNEEIGFNLAKARIEQRLWELEGYALQKSLAGEL